MGKMTHKLIVRSLYPSSVYSFSLSLLSLATIPVDHLNVDQLPITWHLLARDLIFATSAANNSYRLLIYEVKGRWESCRRRSLRVFCRCKLLVW